MKTYNGINDAIDFFARAMELGVDLNMFNKGIYADNDGVSMTVECYDNDSFLNVIDTLKNMGFTTVIPPRNGRCITKLVMDNYCAYVRLIDEL